jgi:MFS family permease
VIGTALGTAVAGALIGPALGALAAEIGTEVVFSAVVAIAAVFAALVLRMPEATMAESQTLSEVLAAAATRPVVTATAFVAAPSLMFGALEVLAPLQIDELGGGHAAIAGGFIAGAAIEAALAPLAGRYSDRAGRRTPFVTGLSIGALSMLGIAAAQSVGVVVGGLLLASFGAGICFTPALTMLAEAAESGRLHQGFAAGLSNMAWATGQVVGGLAGGALAGAAGFAAPSIAVAAVLLLTALYALQSQLPASRPRTAPG